MAILFPVLQSPLDTSEVRKSLTTLSVEIHNELRIINGRITVVENRDTFFNLTVQNDLTVGNLITAPTLTLSTLLNTPAINGATNLELKTGGVTWIVLGNSGRTGFGTATPAVQIDAVSTANSIISAAGSGGNFVAMFSGAGNPSLLYNAGSILRFGTATSKAAGGYVQRMELDGAGNLTPAGYLNHATTLSLRTNAVEGLQMDSSQRLGAGGAPAASALLTLTSTTRGFLPPRMTTTQRDAIGSPATGLVIYNTTTNVLNFYNGSAWGAV
jgi:hypothetical protein